MRLLRQPLLLLGLAAGACTTSMPTNSSTQTSAPAGGSIVAGEATPRLVARQFQFTEGPAADRAGNVFFTDQPNDKIWKYDLNGQLSVFLDRTGRSNGMHFDAQGNLLTCADAQGEIWSIAPDKRVTVLLPAGPGPRLNGPNDLWPHPTSGGIYFTDPYYKRDYWPANQTHVEGQKVYFLPKGQTQPVVVDDQLRKPNGIIGTPDGRTLYVADIEGNQTYRYRIAPDGRLTDRQLFVEQGSDGMTLDNEGNLYLTGHGVTVYSAAGQKILHLDIPEDWTGNICFGGADRKTLFITASKGVYVLPMRVHGV